MLLLHRLDPLCPPCWRRIWLGPVVYLPDDLSIPQLEKRHGLHNLLSVGQHYFRRNLITFSDQATNGDRPRSGIILVDRYVVLTTTNAFARLRPLAHKVIVQELAAYTRTING